MSAGNAPLAAAEAVGGGEEDSESDSEGAGGPPGLHEISETEMAAIIDTERAAPPGQYGLSSNKMALITSDCGKMRNLSIKWP